MEGYRDSWIECTTDEIRVRFYYFPAGTKRIPYGEIRSLTRASMSAARGKGRIWGTVDPGYWASLDPKRATKKVAFVLDIGRRVRPYLTPDFPDAFEEAVRSHAPGLPPSSTGPSPIV